MKHQALFSLKDKSKNNKSVVCCNFAWRFKVNLSIVKYTYMFYIADGNRLMSKIFKFSKLDRAGNKDTVKL